MYYRARYYDPQIGRFTQRDPAGFVDGVNPYAYVGNNPVSLTDPLGLAKLAPIASSNVSGYPGNGGGNAALVGTTIAAQLPRLTTSLPIVENAITRYATPILQAGARALATGPGAALVGMLFPSSLGNPEENWRPSDVGFLPFTSNARGSVYTAEEVANKGLGANPFKGKSFEEIDQLLTERGFNKVGVDPASGKGSYFHPESGRKYYLDKGGEYKEGTELPHVDVHRMRDGVNLEKEGKRRYPLGDSLIQPKP